MKKTNYGYFIVIEGCDGSGKTTLAKVIVNSLDIRYRFFNATINK